MEDRNQKPIGSSWETYKYGSNDDVYIARKPTKQGKRLAFIRFLNVNDARKLENSMTSIWIGNFHLFVSIAKFQKHHKNFVNKKNNETSDKTIENTKDVLTGDSLVHGISYANKAVEDNTIVVLGEVKEEKIIPHLYRVCLDERFEELEIQGMPLGAWIVEAYRKLVETYGSFMFMDVEQNKTQSNDKICVCTKSKDTINDDPVVVIDGKEFILHVKEIDTWWSDIHKIEGSMKEEYVQDEDQSDEDLESLESARSAHDIDANEVVMDSFNLQKNDSETDKEPKGSGDMDESKDDDNNNVVNGEPKTDDEDSNPSVPPGFNSGTFLPKEDYKEAGSEGG
uniref:Uncharacterized protein n=1 Tax=Tanacetum cinerariifolium TaxID=118510 RepID=A0A6L2NTZ5_TANCI|nr:hypothetical protein [Tanacetum cinerariifolium]